MSVNKAIIVGKVGQTPKIHTFDNGNKIANFSVATNDGYTDKNGRFVEITDWHNISCQGFLVNRTELMKPGTTVYVEGSMKRRIYKDKAGIEKTIFEIHADTINLISNFKTPEEKNTNKTPPQITDKIDDIPF